jgi:hypothetical protein
MDSGDLLQCLLELEQKVVKKLHMYTQLLLSTLVEIKK